jgi:pseudouridine-5'-phosphate glycosidase
MAQTTCIAVSTELSEALADGRPVVALETTVVTHGLPPGEGLRAAAEIEQAVRAQGAIPATIGVLRGRARVGLTRSEIQELAETPGVQKLNPSNLAAAIATGRPGSTTVAASLMIAARVGIRVMATGGIGGVHRGAMETADVSADLAALARYPVAVICAGAKAVLDLPRTLEALETFGVPVLGFRTDQFPAFYRRSSGLPVDARIDTIDALAAAVRAHHHIAAPTAVVVANPIPAAAEMPEDLYARSLETALLDVEKSGIRGRAVTPFLLERMRRLTQGASISSNRALLVSNAELAGRLAAALTLAHA